MVFIILHGRHIIQEYLQQINGTLLLVKGTSVSSVINAPVSSRNVECKWVVSQKACIHPGMVFLWNTEWRF